MMSVSQPDISLRIKHPTTHCVALLELNDRKEENNYGSNDLSVDYQQTQNDLHTKYDNCGITILAMTILYCFLWWLWIIYCISTGKITVGYCRSGYTSCNIGKNIPICCTSRRYVNQCYINSICTFQDESAAPFLFQIIILFLIIYYIFTTCKSLRRGIEIHREYQKQKRSNCNTHICTNKLPKYKRIDCRNCVHQDIYDESIGYRYNPQKTTINFLLKSLNLLTVFHFVTDLPSILLNILSGDGSLIIIGMIIFILDLS